MGNVAAIDIGTSSVRLLITDAHGKPLERHMSITRLGQGVDATGMLQAEPLARTLAVLRDYGERIRKHAVVRTRAAATSAARDAQNSAVFFDAAQTAIGVRPELLSGAEEALLSFRGATSGLAHEHGPFLVLDIGGGSTEFVLGTAAPDALISVDMGCVRMTERHFRADPPSPAELEACIADVRQRLAEVRRIVPVHRARRTIGVAGTITALAYMQLGLAHYEPERTHHTLLSENAVKSLLERLIAVDVEKRRGLLTEPKRAEVIVAGAAVLLTIMRELGIGELMVSESDILDGLAASLR